MTHSWNWKTFFLRPSPFAVFILLAAIILAVFYPILPTYFVTDDYNYVGHLMVNAQYYIQGEQLGKWFIDFSAQGLWNPELSVFFRPVVQWLWLTDFIAWGTAATGYHLTNIILHILCSFLVYLIATQTLKNRLGALAAGLLFALHPIHAESVAWIPDRTDVLSALFYLSSALFFILFRRRNRKLFGVWSVIAFALAIGTKENTVALPLVLLAYDALFTFSKMRWKILRAQIPYGLVLICYIAARFIFLGQFGRNTGGGFLSFGIELFAQFYAQSLFQPFIADLNTPLLLVVLALTLIVLAIYRKRAPVWFGVFWLILSLAPATSTAYVAPRLTYAPSAGWAIALAAICVQPLTPPSTRSRALGGALLLFFLLAYGWGLAQRVDDWAAVGSVAAAVPAETLRLHPTLPPGARLYYAGVPDILRNHYIYNDNFSAAIQIAYQNPNLFAARGDRFPILADKFDRTYFLEYRRRTLTERTDLIEALKTRQQCLSTSTLGLAWDFARGDAGWEPLNQLADFQSRDGALMMRSEGTDPYLASPAMNVSTLAVDHLEIDLRARADVTTTQGAIFWLVEGQTDFSPLQQQTWTVRTDGEFHTYRIDFAEGKLMIGDNIVRMRIDPMQALGDIAIKSIRVYVHCSQVEGVICKCSP